MVLRLEGGRGEALREETRSRTGDRAVDRWPAEAAEPTTRVSIVAFTRFTPDGLYFNQEAFSIAMDGELRILDWRQATGSYVYFYLSDASLLDMLLRPALAERLR